MLSTSAIRTSAELGFESINSAAFLETDELLSLRWWRVPIEIKELCDGLDEHSLFVMAEKQSVIFSTLLGAPHSD